jgi:anhydro-N-acetylmuramic acid kinase
MEKTYWVVGIMSGTSMDGIDLALCSFTGHGRQWSYQLHDAVTVHMEEKWRVRLSQLQYQHAQVYVKTDVFFGRYLGELVKEFLDDAGTTADFVASHGHTVFHDPDGWVTAQIGCGQTLSATCGLPVVNDFRRFDVANGGQGAPLVGLGDEILFPGYDACLNLGGFSNISYHGDNKRMAYDISPCNIILNRLAREKGLAYDEGGAIAAEGQIIYPLLNRLDSIPYYQLKGAKSLSREWINREFWHHVRDFDDESLEDRMKTLVAHIGNQIGSNIETLANGNGTDLKVLVTGGGALNETLLDHIRAATDADIEVPDAGLLHFKEALIFGLLGVLRIENSFNTASAYTGASRDSIGGALHGNFSGLLKA